MVKRKRFCASARLQFMFNANYKCHLCKCVLPPSFELDHIIPLHHEKWKKLTIAQAYDQANADSNICVLCNNCHAKKSQKERIQRFQLQWNIKRKKDYTCYGCKKTFSKYFRPGCKCM